MNNTSLPHATGSAMRHRSSVGARLRRFVFTLNNYTDEEYAALQQFAQETTWFIMGKETGENNTPHLQGACVIGKQIAFSTLKSKPGFARCHIEPMRGPPVASRDYCSKQDKNFYELGSLPQPGKRNDLEDVCEDLKNGKSLLEVAQDHPVSIVRYSKGLTFSDLSSQSLGMLTILQKFFGSMDQLVAENPGSCMNSLWKLQRAQITSGLLLPISNGLMDSMDRQLLSLMTSGQKKCHFPSFCVSSTDTHCRSPSKEPTQIGIQNTYSSPPPTIQKSSLSLEPSIDPKIYNSLKGESQEFSTFPLMMENYKLENCYHQPNQILCPHDNLLLKQSFQSLTRPVSQIVDPWNIMQNSTPLVQPQVVNQLLTYAPPIQVVKLSSLPQEEQQSQVLPGQSLQMTDQLQTDFQELSLFPESSLSNADFLDDQYKDFLPVVDDLLQW